MIIKKDLIKREVAGDTLLVPVGKSVYESNGLFILTEMGAFIWDMLPGVETEEEICTAILEQYDAPEDVVKKDVAEFMQKLRELNIV